MGDGFSFLSLFYDKRNDKRIFGLTYQPAEVALNHGGWRTYPQDAR